MNIGFTGTRKGMTKQQGNKVVMLLGNFEVTSIRHGDCVGADEQFHELAQTIGIKTIYIHPPTDGKHRAWLFADFMAEEKDYLTRNKAIVDNCDRMIATPEGEEHLRSGTWSTIRYARKKGKQVTIIFPNGEIKG